MDKYKAKSDGTSLKQHNDDLLNIELQIEKIYNLDDETKIMLKKCIKYHDVGKVVDSFQNNIESKHRIIRHEILSASIKELYDIEKLAIITHHKELKDLKQYIENEYYENEVKEMSEKLNVEIEDVRPFIKKINRVSNSLTKDLNVILIKGYLQYCDHLASAGIKEIEKGFDALDSYKFDVYNSIQKKVFEKGGKKDILLIAPTGLGKTATSLFWSDLNQNKENSKRIYYLLPYTASINSMYKDMYSRNISVSMLHGRIEYFLNRLDIENVKETKNIFKKSVKQINISTIYQIIKVIFSCKRYEMLLAQLKDSLFIVDEIHCFDLEQMSLLLTTLKFLKDKLNISICVMSASIPSNIQKLICNELNITDVIRAEKDDYKIRHKICRINKNIEFDLDNVKKDLDNGKQVLICLNSVKLAQNIYDKLRDYKPKLIHGRFNDRDREAAENDIKTSRLLIGTQAIEVSLDVSYDVMYTEIAPFDSLQQRFGRVNRKGEKGISNIFIYDNTSKIYNEDTIEKTDKILKEIINIDKGFVLEEKTQEYLDYVYNDFDIEKYNSMCDKVNDVINSLRVATFSENAMENMFENDTIKVIPRGLLAEYEELIKSKDYINANALFVNINKFRMKDVEIVKIDDNEVYVVNYLYDDRGLIFDTFE